MCRAECEVVLTYAHIHRTLHRSFGSDRDTVLDTSQRVHGGCEMSGKSTTNGDSTGEWRARTGTHHQIDTQKLRALDGMPSVEEPFTEAVSGSDPYNHTTPGPRSLSEKSR